MQIYEITRRKKLEEGLLDNIKSAVHSAKTGYQGKGEEGGSGVMGALKALSSNTQSAVSDQVIQQKNAEKMGAQLGARIEKLNNVKADQILQAWAKDKPEIDKEIQVKVIPPKVTQINPARVAAQQQAQQDQRQAQQDLQQNKQTTNQQTTNQSPTQTKPMTRTQYNVAGQNLNMRQRVVAKEASARQRRAKARKQQNKTTTGLTTQSNTEQNPPQQDQQSKVQKLQKEFEPRLKSWLDNEFKVKLNFKNFKLDDLITKFETSDDVEEKNAVANIKSGLNTAISSYPNTQAVNSSMKQIINSAVPLAAKLKGQQVGGTRDVSNKEATGGRGLPKNMEIISDDPIIIRHGNKELGLDEKGQWINLATGKIPPAALNQLYDRAAQFSESRKK